MIPKTFNQVTLKKGEAKVTGKMGLAWIYHCLEHYGVINDLRRTLDKEKKSNRAIAASEKIVDGVLSRMAGSDCIEGIEVIRADRALIKSLGKERLTAADTLREYLKGGIEFTYVQERAVIEAMRRSEVEEFTYDNDATYFDCGKKSAEYSYQGRRQYSGLMGYIAELELCNTVEFRPGNISPAAGIKGQLKQAVGQAKEAGKRIRRFRSDSAAHQSDIFKYCDKKGIAYYISLSKNEAVMKTVKRIKGSEWQKLGSAYAERNDTEWAESVYVTDAGVSVRMMVLRWLNPQRDLFNHEEYCYHAIGTNNNELDPMEWLRIHNGRMGSEKYHTELKSGYGCDYAPSHNFEMNRGYFLLGVFAYNLMQIVKLFYLGTETFSWRIKRIRYWFINTCGKIIKTGRRYYCKILNATEETYELFEQCLYQLRIG